MVDACASCAPFARWLERFEAESAGRAGAVDRAPEAASRFEAGIPASAGRASNPRGGTTQTLLSERGLLLSWPPSGGRRVDMKLRPRRPTTWVSPFARVALPRSRRDPCGASGHVRVRAGGGSRLWANTIVQTGRSTSTGDASAIFVNAAASLDRRDTSSVTRTPTRSASPSGSTTPPGSAASRPARTGPAARTGALARSHGTTLGGWRADPVKTPGASCRPRPRSTPACA